MNKKAAFKVVLILALIIPIGYVVIMNALNLVWSKYKIPGYPVGGSDTELHYSFDPREIPASLENNANDIFSQVTSAPEEYMPPTWPPGTFDWDQDIHLRIADALHQVVWRESFDDWSLYGATFWIHRNSDASSSIDRAHFLFFQHESDSYTVHDLVIDALYGDASAGESIVQDSDKWRGFSLSELTKINVDQTLPLADKEGGWKACLGVDEICHVRASFGPYLGIDRFLFLPIYHYEWGWNITYLDKDSGTIFDIYIDPYTDDYRIPRIN